MELNIKRGEVYHVEMPTDSLLELKELDKEDFAAYISWHFMPSGLPGLNDANAFFGFEIGSKMYFLDGWTIKGSEAYVDVIQHYMTDAVEVLRRRGVLANAIEEHRKELEE